MKRIYIRYISHEIRTPLNVVRVGLRVLTNLLEDDTKSDLDIYKQTLNDIQESNMCAVEILNDMLLFDKVEHGNLIVEITLVAWYTYLQKCISPFTSQVRYTQTVTYISIPNI